jgi:hypothetical protein
LGADFTAVFAGTAVTAVSLVVDGPVDLPGELD